MNSGEQPIGGILKSRYNKDRDLKYNFGISIYAYEDMFEKQGGVCAICQLPETSRHNNVIKMLAVDHDHSTGEIRGLLCSNCNTALGLFGDNKETLKAAIKYLK